MSIKQNDVLWDLKREEVEQWLQNKGYELADLEQDANGYYFMQIDSKCTDKDSCEPDELCRCKTKTYLPENLQHI